MLLCCFCFSVFMFLVSLFFVLCFVFFLLSLLFLFLLASLLFCLITSLATTTWRTAPAAQTTRAATTKGALRTTHATEATRTAIETRTTTTAKAEHNRSCLCVPWGQALRLPPCPPSAVFILLLRALVFALFGFFALVCKDHDVNELVNKLRFHNASNINQNGKTPCKMEGWSSNMLQISFAESCKYHAPCNMKGFIFQMSQMPCKIRGSTMQVNVAEGWTYGEYHANSCLLLCFSGLDSFASFLSS